MSLHRLPICLVVGFALAVPGALAQELRWAVSSGGEKSTAAGHSIAVDPNGNVWTVGRFSGAVDFDPGPGTHTLDVGPVFISKLDSAGGYVWAGQINLHAIFSGRNESIAVDLLGNVYLTGWFDETVDFDPGPGEANLTPISSDHDAFVLKLDPDGNLLWVGQFGGATNDCHAHTIAVDSAGNVLTAGNLDGDVDFDPGPGTHVPSGGGNTFISKLDTSGNFVWAKRIGGLGGWDYLPAIAVDGEGRVYTTGWFGAGDFDPGPGVYTMTAESSTDVFISKLTSAGEFVWAKQLTATAALTQFGASIAVDADGNVYTHAPFVGTGDFDPGPGVFEMSSTEIDSFLCKLDAEGAFVWARHYIAAGPVDYDLAIDGSGNVYLPGHAEGDTALRGSRATIGTQSAPGFQSKLSPAGDTIWVKAGASYSIAVDAGANTYTTGGFCCTADFDPGPSTYELTASGVGDFFVLKLGSCVDVVGICDDTNVCTDDVCTVTGECESTPVTGRSCEDGNACTEDDSCDLEGTCNAGPAVDCADGNPCTDETCDPVEQCVVANDDTNACTGLDDGEPCTSKGCVAGSCKDVPLACDDGNPCTDDRCEPGFGCKYGADDSNVCDDGDACTKNQCHAGECVTGGNSCGAPEVGAAPKTRRRPARLEAGPRSGPRARH